MSQPDQSGDGLKVALRTREYPPEVYGGAGMRCAGTHAVGSWH
jgi:hypothetical protein